MARDRGLVSEKEQLKALIRDAAKDGPTMNEFARRLRAKRVQVRANIARTGHVSGISYRLDRVAVKGSSLGQAYGFDGLQKEQRVRYDRVRDLPTLERADEKAEAAVPSLDPRTAEVLRFLDRAKGTIAKTQTSPNIQATAESVESTARVIEAVVTVAREMLADFQRGQDRAVSDLRVPADRLMRQAEILAAWRAWWARQVATWAVVFALVVAAGIGLAWRAHALAQSTHDILQQILENQTKAQAAKAGKRR